jgi:hypothetical protein
MRKAIIFLSSIMLLGGRCDEGNSSIRIRDRMKADSLFEKNFSDIKKTFSNSNYLTKKESDFIYLISYFSGIQVSMKSGYIGALDLNKQQLAAFEDWYKKNKDRIEWNKAVRGLTIISSNDFSDKNLTELKKLKIH